MGQFNEKTNQSEGRGKLMRKDGSLLYEGYHLNNKFNGKGRLILYDTMKFQYYILEGFWSQVNNELKY